MGRAGVNFGSTGVLQGLGSQGDGAGSVDHVVNQDGPLALDVTDDVHDFGNVGLWPALVDDGD